DSATYMDTEGIRRNILGVTVGVVETTLKAVSRTIDQLLHRPAEMQKATEAARRHDDAMMLKYAFEAMRFNPQNHVIYRWCEMPYILAEGTDRATAVPANSLVFAATLSAMFDSGKVSDPEVFKPDRPDDNYLFFGYGLHACLGRHLGPMLIREVVKRVLTLPNLRRAQDDGFDPLDLLPRHFMLEFDR
ncbi:MAG: cytochrome P450, partial [Nitrospiraceae bacterium]